MFLFIFISRFNILNFQLFKYISCSYLSKELEKATEQIKNSNTSHVLIYPKKTLEIQSKKINSNTSHVLIYHECLEYEIEIEEFKYISCSYLSTGRVIINIRLIDSNTSHVLIYRLHLRLRPVR